MREKILKYTDANNNELILDICFAAVGFILGGAKVSGTFAPFCLAFCMASSRQAMIFSFGGGMLGTMMFFDSSSIIYICSLIVGITLKLIFNPNSYFLSAIFSIISLGSIQLASIMIIPVGFSTWLLTYAEVLLCGSITVLFQCALKSIHKKSHSTSELIGFSVLSMAVLVSFCQINLFGFNLGRFISAFVTVEATLLIGVTGGAIAGLICTIGLSLFTKDFSLGGVVVAVSGFIAGVFRPVGRAVEASMFVGVYLLGCAFFGGLNVQSLIEVIIAVVLAAVVPSSKILKTIGINKVKSVNNNIKVNDDVALKLQFTANTLLDLQQSVEDCSKMMDNLTSKDISNIYVQTADDVCRNCGLNTFCWVTSYNDIMRSFNKLSSILRENGSVSKDDMPIFFRNKCCKLSDLVNSINFFYKDFLCKEQTSRRVNEARSIASEQFTGMSELLMEMGEEISDIVRVDEKSALIVKNILRDRGSEANGISCLLDKFDHLTIDIYLDELPDKMEMRYLTDIISDEIDRQFEFPTTTKANGKYRISFFEAASLSVDFAAVQTSPKGNAYCGDSYDFFMDTRGFAHMILSDGMGNGDRAAVDSLMTCSTMRRLLQTGFGFGSAFKLLNLSFAIKSNDESLATIDICTIDLYTGKTKFVKAGATSSYIKKRGHITEFASTSLPIGIIHGLKYDKEEIKLSKGDIVVMVTDGATSSGLDWIAAELKLVKEQSAKQIADEILKSAKKRSNPEHIDDITVLVSKII